MVDAIENGVATENEDCGCSGGWYALKVAVRVALVAFLAFAPVRDNFFVDWDDQENFLENPSFRGVGLEQVKWAWTTTLLGVYQPISWMLLEGEYSAWGLEPTGYHLFSLGLHTVDAMVLFCLIRAILRRGISGLDERKERWLTACAGMGAALFAVHPLRTEVVAWASCQPYLPSALFAMLSVLVYLKAHDEGRREWSRRRWLLGSLGLFVAALLSKAVAVSVPVVLLVLDGYPLRRLRGGWVWLEKAPFLVVAGVFMGVAVWSKDESGMIVGAGKAGLGSGIALAGYSVWFYLGKTIWPFDLNAYYMRPEQVDWAEPRFGLALLGTAVLTGMLVAYRKRWPALLATWVAYLAILGPNSGLIITGRQIAADRYSYCAMMAWAVLGASGLYMLGVRGRRAAVGTTVPCVLAIGGLVLLAWPQSQSWENSVTLWSHAIEHGSSGTPDLHNNVAMVHSMLGDDDKAIAELDEAIRLKPDYAEGLRNRGLVLKKLGKADEAMEAFAKAVKSEPAYLQARADLAVELTRHKRLDEAVAQYEAVARSRPGSAEAQCQLGMALVRLGKLDEARTKLNEALRLKPGLKDARRGLDALLAARMQRALHP